MTEKEKLSSPFSIENLLSTTAAKKGSQREDAPKEKNSSHLQSLKRKYIQELSGIFFIFKKQLCLLLSLWITVLAKYIFSGIEIRILMSLQNTKFTSLVFVKTPPKKRGRRANYFLWWMLIPIRLSNNNVMFNITFFCLFVKRNISNNIKVYKKIFFFFLIQIQY